MSWFNRIFRKTKPKRKILFVCTGNTCRSPMAERLMKKILGSEYDVESAGLAANPDSPASDNAIEVMREHDIDLSNHRSRKLTTEMISEADNIYVMTPYALQAIKELVPTANVQMLHEKGISDPYGRNVDVYRQSADDIWNAVQQRQKDLGEH